MFATLAFPKMIITNNITAFSSSDFKNSPLELVSITLQLQYHPASNSLAERVVQGF